MDYRSANNMESTLEHIWINRHGAPLRFSSDSEFQTAPMQRFLKKHEITPFERSVFRHNKTGVVERKHFTINLILEKLKLAIEITPHATLLSRSTFLSKIVSGNRILSSFESAIGYTPVIIFIPRTVVINQLLTAYLEQAATRALQKLMSSRSPSTIPPSMLTPGTLVLYFYKTTKHTDPI